jgi:flagellar biosynthesis component FlhA
MDASMIFTPSTTPSTPKVTVESFTCTNMFTSCAFQKKDKNKKRQKKTKKDKKKDKKKTKKDKKRQKKKKTGRKKQILCRRIICWVVHSGNH